MKKETLHLIHFSYRKIKTGWNSISIGEKFLNSDDNVIKKRNRNQNRRLEKIESKLKILDIGSIRYDIYERLEDGKSRLRLPKNNNKNN